jgi:hypothetical protein
MDAVNPSYYRSNGYGVETVEMMRKVFGDADTATFCRLNAFKYRLRAGHKAGNPAAQDLAKEAWYLAKCAELSGVEADGEDNPGSNPEAAQTPPEVPPKRRRKAAPAPEKAPPRSYHRWSEEDVELLRGMSNDEAAAHFNLSPSTVYKAKMRFGAKTKKTDGGRKARSLMEAEGVNL